MKTAEEWSKELCWNAPGRDPSGIREIRAIQDDAIESVANSIESIEMAGGAFFAMQIRKRKPRPPVEHKKCPGCDKGGRVRISESNLCQIVCAGSFPCFQTAFFADETKAWEVWGKRA